MQHLTRAISILQLIYVELFFCVSISELVATISEKQTQSMTAENYIYELKSAPRIEQLSSLLVFHYSPALRTTFDLPKHLLQIMLFKSASIMLLVTAVIGRAVPDNAETADLQSWPSLPDQKQAELGSWHLLNDTKVAKRTNELETTLPDGNECDIQVSSGSGTQGWLPGDYHTLFGIAGSALTNSIARNSRTQVGLTTSMTDHNGHNHQVDCEVTVTGQSYVSVAGAYQNVQQALVAAQDLAVEGWTGLIGTSRSTLRIWFGNVVAISIAVNVLN